uniref:RING-type domain-containing protein n=1 Tax=Ditylenchus dipsaci TaxID=166011 RepID=A0A915DBV4_9BILA
MEHLHSLVPIATSNIADLNCLIPRCCRCRREFSVYDNTPFILSCSHTFCCKCMAELNSNTAKNRRCPMCLVKYTTYQVNLHCLDLVVRIKIMTGNLNSCNECLKLVSAQHLRRCLTCEEEVLARTDFSRARTSKTRVSCVVCLECALENHKSHELRIETSLFTTVNRPTSIHTNNQQWSMGITTGQTTMRTLAKEENSKKSWSESAQKDKAEKGAPKSEQTPLRVPIKNRFEYSNNRGSFQLRHQRSYVNAPSSIGVNATPPTAANNITMNKSVLPPICYTSIVDNSFYNKCP